MEYVYKAPKFTTGNRCGHVKAYPRTYTRNENKANTYGTIHTALDNLANYYDSPDKYLGELRHVRYHVDPENPKNIFFMNKQRSELREAVILVLGLLIDTCDYETMQSVVFRNSKREPITLLYISMFFSMSYKRVYRALRWLKKAGYVELEYRSHYVGTKFVKVPAIKYVSQKVFTHLDVSHLQLQKDLHRARTKHEKREHGVRPQRSFYDRQMRQDSTPLGDIVTKMAKEAEDSNRIPPAAESRANCKAILAKFKKQPPS